jgi:DNA-binding response OmpR family regulator
MDVLLVDDEQELISTLAERLQFRGIKADWVTNGQAALVCVKEKKYDIAVLDIKMPGISGLELGEQIKALDPVVHIIFCTGHGSDSYVKAGSSQYGEAYYLSKPLDINKLIEKMTQLKSE